MSVLHGFHQFYTFCPTTLSNDLNHLAAKMTTGEDAEMKSNKLWNPNKPSNFPALQEGILETIGAFLDGKFHADEASLEMITPFLKLQSDADNGEVHEISICRSTDYRSNWEILAATVIC